ncbi:hypothetical protein HZB60_12325 [candidate division KSB1 bacterium]|nr:hypothetical protein [candidate division KSB1 bacterium]
MIEQIKDLLRFYSQRYHVPIDLLVEAHQIDAWDRNGLIVAMPMSGPAELLLGEAIFHFDPEFGLKLRGDLLVQNAQSVGRSGKTWLALHLCPVNASASAFVRNVIDQQLPRMCREYRHEQKDALVDAIASCVQDRKRELQSSLREDQYELERLSLQLMQLSRKIESDRQILRLFEKSAEWIKARAIRTYVDLLKLVPGCYQHFVIDEESIFGTTHEIAITYDDHTYVFDPYEIEINMRTGKLMIRGGTNVNDYLHPHISSDSVCFGNIGHMVSRMTGELDLFGLFQLVHTFLTTYNASDPYQRIEKWDPSWEEECDDDEPYCSWCDDYGHEICDCESC